MSDPTPPGCHTSSPGTPPAAVTAPVPREGTAESAGAPARPAVSVLVATYNRSNVLRLAIETVRWQTRPDWELIVIGDACTDDTADVVAGIGDPRVRFLNLERG